MRQFSRSNIKCDDNIILLSANDNFSEHSLYRKLHFLASSTVNLKQEISELETIKLGKQTKHLWKLGTSLKLLRLHQYTLRNLGSTLTVLLNTSAPQKNVSKITFAKKHFWLP